MKAGVAPAFLFGSDGSSSLVLRGNPPQQTLMACNEHWKRFPFFLRSERTHWRPIPAVPAMRA